MDEEALAVSVVLLHVPADDDVYGNDHVLYTRSGCAVAPDVAVFPMDDEERADGVGCRQDGEVRADGVVPAPIQKERVLN